ncbi:hypothetical protein AB833_16625 [Chromatiales bacterium (ex Bugula neritina AB1)]|nr:hypothetical protein AB833_16625 [Chromatiales bacterium (ex Bugula neritina AB1)]
MKVFSFKFMRPAALFCLMATLFALSTHQKMVSRSWHQPLDVVIYPINADSSPATQRYINSLRDSDFAEIDQWMSREAKRHNLGIETPLLTRLGPTVNSMPPPLPAQPDTLKSMLWSLQLRFWVFRNTPDNDSNLRRIRVFVAYQTGENDTPLAHSVGLQKGLIGVVHAFSHPGQTRQNNIVIAHEILHTVGAIDKYSITGAPVYPHGFTNPHSKPLYPQRFAEIMAGSIAISPNQSQMADSLRSTRINTTTAREIAWIE